jgi:HemY protein
MLWTLLKFVIYVAIVVATVFGLMFLIDNGGTGMADAVVTLNGTEYVLTPLMLAILLLVLFVGLWLALKLAGLTIAILKFINGDETALSRYFDRNRERKGFEAMSQGMMALASGEGRLAIAKANKAQKYLNKPELTDLITAQAAEMVGDKKKAEEVYKRLLKTETTRFVGVRGLMKQKLDAGDTDTALQLAERAFAIKPKHTEVQDTLLQLQAEKKDWDGARKTLSAKLKNGSLPRDVYRRRDAVLALSKAAEITDDAERAAAFEAAIEANKASPDLIPAASMAARGLVEKGKKRNAIRVIKKAWEVHPHPDLAAAFAEIEPDETPDARLKRFVQLTRIQPDHRETKLLKAELNLAAEDFPEARRSLGDLHETDADARVLTVMAAIEKGEGSSDAVVKGWLAKALTAPRGPQWVCDNCNTIHAQWQPTCSSCGAFDTLSWRTPPQSEVVLPAGANMLPLIVGALEDKSDEVVPVAQETTPEVIDVTDASADPATEEEAPAPQVEDAEIVEDDKPAETKA